MGGNDSSWSFEGGGECGAPESGGSPERCGGEPSRSVEAGGGSLVSGPVGLAEISGRLDKLTALFEARVSEGEQQQEWIGQLISQLAEYRNDFVFNNITGRIFRDLIQVYDTLCQTLDAAERQGAEDMAARLRNLCRQVLRTLDRHGAEQIENAGHPGFDEAEQEAIGVRAVGRPEDDGLVVESVRCGFRYGTRLLRPESVIVGRYELEGSEADG